MTEVWKAVPGFEGAYEVSDQGRVRSLDRVIQKKTRWGGVSDVLTPGRVLSLGPHKGGYRTVHLYAGGRQRATVLHILVAEVFCGPRPSPAHEVRHLDGDPKNCSAVNLRWGTRIENEQDKERHGTRLRGEDCPVSKLSIDDVLAIRSRRGELQKDLAEEYGCTFGNISAVQLGRSWRHV